MKTRLVLPLGKHRLGDTRRHGWHLASGSTRRTKTHGQLLADSKDFRSDLERNGDRSKKEIGVIV